MTSKQFFIRFFAGVFLLLGAIIGFNRIVDPFWYYRDTEIKGFNAIKSQFQQFEQIIKPALVVRDQPEAVIFGSSYMEVGLDPTNPFFTNHGQFKSMNLGLAGVYWSNIQCEFEFAVRHAHIKRAVVGFHPDGLPLVNCEKTFPSIGQVNIAKLLISSSSLRASIRTIQEQKDGYNKFTPEGMYFYNRSGSGDTLPLFQGALLSISGNPCSPTGSNEALKNLDTDVVFDLRGLERMIQTAKEYGVELVLFNLPRHAYSLEMDRQCGHQDQRWKIMKQIAKLVDSQSAQGAQVSAWEFYGYNDVTAVPVKLPQKYWQDPTHFNFEMGNLMLEDVFDPARSKPVLGKRLTSGHIEIDYQEFLKGRTEYLQLHPEFQADLQEALRLE